MKKVSKTSFPKIKKKIKDFILDESGNVTAKTALAVSAVWVVWLWLNEAFAWTCSIIPTGHFNWTANWHYNWTWLFWAGVTPTSMVSCWWVNTSYTYDSWCWPLSCNPISWVVNWHYNITPTCSSTLISAHCNHISSWSWSWDWGGDSCG